MIRKIYLGQKLFLQDFHNCFSLTLLQRPVFEGGIRCPLQDPRIWNMVMPRFMLESLGLQLSGPLDDIMGLCWRRALSPRMVNRVPSAIFTFLGRPCLSTLYEASATVIQSHTTPWRKLSLNKGLSYPLLETALRNAKKLPDRDKLFYWKLLCNGLRTAERMGWMGGPQECSFCGSGRDSLAHWADCESIKSSVAKSLTLEWHLCSFKGLPSLQELRRNLIIWRIVWATACEAKTRSIPPCKAQFALRARLLQQRPSMLACLLQRNTPVEEPTRGGGYETGLKLLPGWTCFTDGSASGNPGPAGAGMIAYDHLSNLVIEKSISISQATNNWAEIFAIGEMCRLLRKKIERDPRVTPGMITIYSDSKLALSAIKDRKVSLAIRMVTLFAIKEKELLSQITPVYVEWIKGHAGAQGNEAADFLAKMGAYQSEQSTGNILIPLELSVGHFGSYVFSDFGLRGEDPRPGGR